MSDLQAKVEKLLKRKDIGKRLKFDDGKTINEALKSEAQRLQQILIKHINAYYASYDPVQYNRTYQMRDSVKVETSVKDMSIAVYFNQKAYHPSLLGGNPGFTPVLIDSGWVWKNQSVPIYRFTAYEGYGFIQQAVDEFNRTTKYKFQVNVESKYKESYYAQM